MYRASGQFERAASLLLEADDAKGAVDLAMIEEMAVTLMVIGEWPRAVDLSQPLVDDAAMAGDYRLHYPYAVVLEESERIGEAADAFLRCVEIEKELSDSRRGGGAGLPATRDEEEDLSFLPLEAQDIRRASQSGTQAFLYRWGVPRGWMYGMSGDYHGGRGQGQHEVVA